MKHGGLFIGLAYALSYVLSGSNVLGNEAPVWRCGNMYTNQPRADQSCESVTLSTREETQVPQPLRPPTPASKTTAPRVNSLAQRERDGQAKDILNNELKRLNERCQAATQSTAQQRCAADQAALKRELARLP
ncbi:MAG: hypothetical protein HQ455_06870 [Burkholderiales bacterium]|nr:hypothetical protein [Burkholderiales bacterium]